MTALRDCFTQLVSVCMPGHPLVFLSQQTPLSCSDFHPLFPAAAEATCQKTQLLYCLPGQVCVGSAVNTTLDTECIGYKIALLLVQFLYIFYCIYNTLWKHSDVDEKT